MLASEWLYASLAIVLGAHLVTLAYVALSRVREAAARADGAAEASDDEEVTRCAECGVANDPGYRFCRNCVAELPGATPAGTSPGRRSQPN